MIAEAVSVPLSDTHLFYGMPVPYIPGLHAEVRAQVCAGHAYKRLVLFDDAGVIRWVIRPDPSSSGHARGLVLIHRNQGLRCGYHVQRRVPWRPGQHGPVLAALSQVAHHECYARWRAGYYDALLSHVDRVLRSLGHLPVDVWQLRQNYVVDEDVFLSTSCSDCGCCAAVIITLEEALRTTGTPRASYLGSALRRSCPVGANGALR